MNTRPNCPKVSERSNPDAGHSVRNVRESLRTRTFGRPSDDGNPTASHPVFEFRACEKTTQSSVFIPQTQEFRPPYPPSATALTGLDAMRVAHRPIERTEIAREARRLARLGLRPRDMAGPLGLSERVVADLLTEAVHAPE